MVSLDPSHCTDRASKKASHLNEIVGPPHQISTFVLLAVIGVVYVIHGSFYFSFSLLTSLQRLRMH